MNPQLQFKIKQVIEAFRGEDFDVAHLIVQEILQNDIDSANTVFELGMAYTNAKKFEEAMTVFRSLQPYKKDDVRIPYNMGLIHSLQSKHQLALEAYELALSIKPDDAETLINMGSTYIDTKNYALAQDFLEKAIKIRPDIPEAWANIGIALFNLNLYQDAIQAYDQSIVLFPENHEAWGNKGIALRELKRYDEAIDHFDKALSLKPDCSQTWNNKGIALHELKRYGEAIDHFDNALSLKPDYAEVLLNKGAAFKDLKRYKEAIALTDKALIINPKIAKAWSNKGATLYELKQYDKAIANYEKAVSLKPDIDWAHGDLVHTKMKVCDWSNLENSLDIITKNVVENKKIAQPFSLLALIDDPLLHKKSAEIYSQAKYPLNHALGEIAKSYRREKIRIGYFSADFRNHPVSFLMAELFELHDKSQFEIIAFSSGPDDESLMRKRVVKAFDQFIDVCGMSDLEIAKLARKLGIDIAVDLGGFTAESRLGIFAYRAAPIQLSYIGYLATTGTAYIDYILADNTIILDGSEHYFSEKIIRLPSYQVNDSQKKISDKKFTRKELELPENSFVFTSFNNSFKILPSTFTSWMNILKSCKGSSLFLYAENEWVKQNLVKEAEARGVDGRRLVFGKHLPVDQYLSRYKACDLFLDTVPYNAGTTASDALWAGLPVLTLAGKSFVSRVAASVLNAIDLPELITTTRADYEALAIELAHSPEKLSAIKRKLIQNRETTHLFNTLKFKENIESAYLKIYDRYQSDLPPDHVSII